MGKEERYDIVIIGAGHNGTTAAAYLAKCGLSVCVLEERPECGGAQETCEPIAGVRIQPHAIANYGGSAPGWEQLELWKYGFRMDWDPNVTVNLDPNQSFMTSDGLVPLTNEDIAGWTKITGQIGAPPFMKELMRATFWCPPHPPEVELNEDNIPYMQVYKQYQPEVWTRELLEMTLFDLMDEYLVTEPFKVMQAYIALSSGAHGHMEGVAIPALCSAATVMPPAVAKPVAARGNMHGYFHALFRCAVAHGAVFRACCPVEEILVDDGRAMGVRLRDDATWGAKKIWANKAVISACHIKPTFLDLIGPRNLDSGFLQRIKDLSLKGGSLYMSHFLTRERLRYKPQYQLHPPDEYGAFHGGFFPLDSRENYYENVRVVLGEQSNLDIPPERAMWGMVGGELYDPTNPQSTRPGQYINGPLWMMVPTPQYNVDGVDAMDKDKDEVGRVHARCPLQRGREPRRRQPDPHVQREPLRAGVPQHRDARRVVVRDPLRSRPVVERAAAAGDGSLPGPRHRRPLHGPSVERPSRRPLPDGRRLQPDAHPDRGWDRRARRLVVRVAVVHPAGRQDPGEPAS